MFLENIKYYNQLKSINYAIKIAIKDYGEKIKIGCVYDDDSSDVYNSDRLVCKEIIKIY